MLSAFKICEIRFKKIIMELDSSKPGSSSVLSDQEGTVDNIKTLLQFWEFEILNHVQSEQLIRDELEDISERITPRDIARLGSLFEGITLGMIQATAFIRNKAECNSNYTVTDYINQFNKHPIELDYFPTRSARGVYIAFKMNVEQLKDEFTKTLLGYIAHLNVDELTEDLFYEKFGEKRVKSSIEELLKFSIIKQNENVLSMHRFIKLCCQFHRKSDEQHNIRLVQELTSNKFLHHFENYIILNHSTIEQVYCEAVEQGTNFEDVFKTLSDRMRILKVDISILNEWSARHFAIFFGCLDLLKKFEIQGLFCDYRNNWSLLHVVGLRDLGFLYSDSFEYALKVSNINGKTRQGLTALHIFSVFGYTEDIRKLLFACDVNAVDENGNTALHWAARRPKHPLLALDVLLNHGLDIEIKNKHGETALDILDNRTTYYNINDKMTRKCNYLSVIFTRKSYEGVLEKQIISTLTFSKKNEAEKWFMKTLDDYKRSGSSSVFVAELVTYLNSSLTALRAAIIYLNLTSRSVQELLHTLKHHNSVEFKAVLEVITIKNINVLKMICCLFHFISHDEKLFIRVMGAGYLSSNDLTTSYSDKDCVDQYKCFNENFVFDEFIKSVAHVFMLQQNKLYDVMNYLLQYSASELSEFTRLIDVKNFYIEQSQVPSRFKLQLEQFKDVCEVKSLDKWSGIHFACLDERSGSLQLVLKMIKSEDVNLGIDGVYPIHLACFGTNVDKICLLVSDMGADLAVKTENGLTPLHLAAIKGDWGVVHILLCLEAVQTTDASGRTPLDYAMIYGHQEVANLLSNK